MTSAVATSAALRHGYECLLLDLDGTLYRGSDVVPGAVQALEGSTERLLFVTNNASKSPAAVARHLSDLGFVASEDDVVTSSQAAARLLAEHLEPGSKVLIVGTQALADEVELLGLVAVRGADDEPAAVVQGHSTETAWPALAEAAFAIRAGALWIATNTDATLPTERGLAPGNGSMVAAVRVATDRDPIVAGKPAAPLLEDALQRSGTRSAIVVGDRLDTDIEGANTVGLDSLLVLSGVSTADDLLRALPARRPKYLAFSLASLDHPSSEPGDSWSAKFTGTDIELSGSGDAVAALAVTAAIAWAHPEFGAVVASSPEAEDAVRSWTNPSDRTSTLAVSLPAPLRDID